MRFADRRVAGIRLGERLRSLIEGDVVVFGLVRGGLPVGFEVARSLAAPLLPLVVRKLGVPHQPELAFGAIALDTVWMNEAMVHAAGLDPETVSSTVARKRQQVQERLRRLQPDRCALEMAGATVILVDDGIATGATMFASVEAVRERDARRVVVAAPVCAPDTLPALRHVADLVVCLAAPEPFSAVGAWYEDFAQVPEDEVAALLAESGSDQRGANTSS